MIFADNRQHFFKPLTGKHRGRVAECLTQLYQRVYGALADYGQSLSREQIVDVFQQAWLRAPELDADAADDDVLPNDERERAAWVLRLLVEHGWLERHVDEASLSSSYSFSLAGRQFTQPMLEDEGQRMRARHRNTRNTRHALSAFVEAEVPDVHDLLSAAEYSERIVTDFSDIIAELESRTRQLVREVEAQQLVQDAAEQFFAFMTRRFEPDVSVRLSADSVEQHRLAIVALVRRARSKPKAFMAAAERELRRLYPDALERPEQSLLLLLLDSIETRLQNACELMLPALRAALNNFTRRADIIMRQLAYISRQGHHDVSGLCARIASLDESAQDALLERAADALAGVGLGLLDPGQVRLRERASRRVVGTLLEDAGLHMDDDARQQMSVELALSSAFNITRQDLLSYLSRQLREGRTLSTRELEVHGAPDLLASAHAIELAALTGEGGARFSLTPKGEVHSDTYFSQRDEYLIELLPGEDAEHAA